MISYVLIADSGRYTDALTSYTAFHAEHAIPPDNNRMQGKAES